MPKQNGSVLITGANKGIGLSIAKIFARHSDYKLLLLARDHNDLKKAEQICREEGASDVSIYATDLLELNDEVIRDLKKESIRVLVNNAGTYLYKKLQDTSVENFTRQYELNVLSAFDLTSELLPVLKEQEYALIVNICSVASLKGFADSGAYAMSKHALLGYTRSLREELKNDHIAVSALNLGQTYSTSWKDIDVDENDLIDPEDVGKIILNLSSLSPRSVVEEMTIMPQKGQIPPV